MSLSRRFQSTDRWILNLALALLLVPIGASAQGAVLAGESAGVAGAKPREGSMAGTRSWAMGTLYTRDGKPWVGAELRMVTHALRSYPRQTGLDRVTVLSDARGRFRAKLLVGRRYSAWAIQELEGSSYLCSDVENGIQAGSRFELWSRGAFPPIHLKLSGMERWKGPSPFVVRMQTQGEMFDEYTLPAARNATIPLPSAPGGYRRWTLLDAKGEMLAWGSVSSRPVRRELQKKPVIYNGRVRTGTEIIVKILNPDGTKAVEGARLTYRSYNDLFPLGVTDDRGLARVRLPQGISRSRSSRYVSTRMVVLSDRGPALYVSGQRVSIIAGRDLDSMWKEGKADLTLRMPKGYRLSGKLETRDGQALVGVKLALQMNTERHGRGSYQLEPYFTETAADGSFAFSCMNPHSPYRILAYLHAKALAEIKTRDGYPEPALAILASGGPHTGPNRDLGVIRFAECRRVDVQALNFEGRPARGAEARIADSSAHTARASFLRMYVDIGFDHRGRASVLLNPAAVSGFALTGVSEGGFGFLALTAKKLFGVERKPHVLKIGRTFRVAGVCLDDKGKPLPFAAVTVRDSDYRARSTEYLLGLRRRTWTLRCDEQGHFEGRVPRTTRLTVSARLNGITGESPSYYSKRSLSFPIDADRSDLSLELGQRAQVKRRGLVAPGGLQIGLGGGKVLRRAPGAKNAKKLLEAKKRELKLKIEKLKKEAAEKEAAENRRKR